MMFDFDDIEEKKMKKYLLNDKIFDSLDSAKKDYFDDKAYYDSMIKSQWSDKWLQKIKEIDDYRYDSDDEPMDSYEDSIEASKAAEIRRQLEEAHRKQEAEEARRRAAKEEAKRKATEAKAKAEEEAKTEDAVGELVDAFLVRK